VKLPLVTGINLTPSMQIDAREGVLAWYKFLGFDMPIKLSSDTHSETNNIQSKGERRAKLVPYLKIHGQSPRLFCSSIGKINCSHDTNSL
jgi:hypothetical protein